MDQRMDALRRANEVRALRAQLKRDLKAGRVSMGCSCQDTPEIGNSRAPRSRARMEGSNRGARVSVKAPGSLGGSSRTVTLLRAEYSRRSRGRMQAARGRSAGLLPISGVSWLYAT